LSEPNVGTVFFAALVTALATGLGALPLLFIRSAGRFALGASNAVASGVMLAASVSLSLQGADRSLWRAGVGIALGVCFVLVTERYLEHDHGHAMGSLRGEDARRALLIVGVMTVHSAAEGIGVGAAFADGSTLGLLIAVAIAVHNIPEGLAISLVLVPRGTSVGAAAGWSIFSSLPQPLLAVPAFVFVEQFRSFLPVGLGFAGGAMAWLVVAELLPAARRAASAQTVAAALALSFAAMLALQVLLARA
jgi:zinc transporter ZupT